MKYRPNMRTKLEKSSMTAEKASRDTFWAGGGGGGVEGGLSDNAGAGNENVTYKVKSRCFRLQTL